jgi:pyridoxal 5'-phosphate synthase pdxS subunit
VSQARIGHFVEAQILQECGIDYIDESEVLTPADEIHHINKHKLKVPVLCGCRDLGEALRRIAEVRNSPSPVAKLYRTDL